GDRPTSPSSPSSTPARRRTSGHRASRSSSEGKTLSTAPARTSPSSCDTRRTRRTTRSTIPPRHSASTSFATFSPTRRRAAASRKEIGGLAEVERRNRKKGTLLYGAIDQRADFYRGPVDKESRSLMNVVFRLPTEELEKRFIREATERKMVGLAGHRSTGGIR